eukprot:Platyproteum_vivax@DN8051_c0_g1_i1.p2
MTYHEKLMARLLVNVKGQKVMSNNDKALYGKLGSKVAPQKTKILPKIIKKMHKKDYEFDFFPATSAELAKFKALFKFYAADPAGKPKDVWKTFPTHDVISLAAFLQFIKSFKLETALPK